MSRANDPDAFDYRVAYACDVIAKKIPARRAFDNCFENVDGEVVAVAIYRRSLRNPKIRRNLWKYLNRDLTVRQAFAARRRPRSTFRAWSRELWAIRNAERERDRLAHLAKQQQGIAP